MGSPARRWRDAASTTAVVVVLAALSAVQTVPTPGRFGKAFAPNKGDPVFNMWALRTALSNVLHHPSNVLRANIFWPHPDTLAWSDSMIGFAPIFGPAYVLSGRNTVAAYNVTLMLSYLAGGLALHALARYFGASRLAALVAGVLFTLAPWRSTNVSHLQLTAIALTLVTVHALLRWLETRRLRWGAAVGALVAWTFYCSVYFAVLDGIVIASVVVVWLLARPARRERARDVVTGLAVMVVTGAALLAPIAVPYLRLQREGPFRRTDAEILRFDGSGFIRPPTWLHRLVGRPRGAADTEVFFPGLILGVLFSFGVVLWVIGSHGRRRLRSDQSGAGAITPLPGPDGDDRERWRRREFAAPLAVAMLAASLMTIGPRQGLPSAPYEAVRAVLPGMRSVRDVTRFYSFTLAGLALVAAWVLTVLQGRIRARGTTAPWRAGALALPLTLGVTGSAELLVRPPLDTVDLTEPDLRVQRALARMPAGVVVEAPVPSTIAGWIFSQTEWQLQSLADGQPRIVGYSGSFPPEVGALLDTIRAIPDEKAVTKIRSTGARYLVLHGRDSPCASAYGPEEVASIVAALERQAAVERVERVGASAIAVLRKSPPPAAPVPQWTPRTLPPCPPREKPNGTAFRGDSTERYGLVASIAAPSTAVVVEEGFASFEVEVMNRGTARWLPATTEGPGAVNLGVHLLDAAGALRTYGFARAPISTAVVEPGASVRVAVKVAVPPGRWILELQAVAELVAWIDGATRVAITVPG